MKNSVKNPLKNSNGQVAIFVALIFQVLFVFFAMIVNVGLLVHHKINLQNSVDLAAYYGAMKQAEMLNAIGHVNYQIRQSYKLLTFRYTQLGGAGTTGSVNVKHPYSGVTQQIVRDGDDPLPFETPFCLPYNPIDLVNGNNNPESYCKEPKQLIVPVPGIPSFGTDTSWTGFQGGLISVAKQLQQAAYGYCRYAMGTNWMQLAKFIAAYKLDIRNRKKLLLGLANELSKENPRDIQGDSIKEGVYKTLIRNLTYPNKEGLIEKFRDNGTGAGTKEFDFKFVNSFSMGSCKGNPTEVNPPGWLKEIFIYPTFAAFDGTCGNGNQDAPIDFHLTLFNNGPIAPSVNIPPELKQTAQDLAQIASEFPSSNPQQLLNRASIGFEKDPWCLGYVGVSATTTPKIPFSPAGAITMKATAFAKPFGGRVGPWYGTTWDYNPGPDSKSNPAALTDELLPIRVEANQIIGAASEDEMNRLRAKKRFFPNHSRYLGDKVGIVSDLTVGQFAKAIHQKLGSIKLAWFNHIAYDNFDIKSESGDILAWDKDTNQSVPLRDLELSAIAPDQFDTATYSIDPDFYNNYITKIQKGYGSEFQFLLRGDLGSRMNGNEEQKRFSVRNQIEALTSSNKNMVDWQAKLTYYLNTFGQLLTSWQQKSPDEYVLDSSRFGKCLTEKSDPISQNISDEKFFTMGSCKNGGRTGYSVKLVDGKFLRNELQGAPQYELGGKNKFGSVKNPPPPPDNF